MESHCIEIDSSNLVPLVASDSINSTTEQHVHGNGNVSFHLFENLKHLYFKSMSSEEGGPGVAILNEKDEEIIRCPIPRLENRTAGFCFPLNDLSGTTVVTARRGLQSINITTGKGDVSLGRLKTPNFGRTFQLKSTFGISFDIQPKNGDIFCCPCCITQFIILSHVDHTSQIGSFNFNSKNGIAEMKLGSTATTTTEEELSLSDRTIALICTAGVILFEWYFRKSELGYHGQRGSLCCLSYIAFCFLIVIITIIVSLLAFYHL